MAKKYDESDYRLLKEIRDDSDLTIRELGDKLDMHPNTILKRIKRLKKDNVIIKKLSEVDFYKIGYDIRALIQIRVKMSSDWEGPISELAKHKHIVSFYAVTGIPDFVAIVQVQNKEDLQSLLRRIQKSNVVVKTTTHFMISCYKHPYEYNPL